MEKHEGKRNKRKSGLEKKNSKTHAQLQVNKKPRISKKKAKSMTKISLKAAMAGRTPRGLVGSCGHQSVGRGQWPG